MLLNWTSSVPIWESWGSLYVGFAMVFHIVILLQVLFSFVHQHLAYSNKDLYIATMNIAGKQMQRANSFLRNSSKDAALFHASWPAGQVFPEF